jgi:Tol biopolymer transport system component
MNRTWTAAALLLALAVPAGASHVESLSRIPPRRASETAGGPSRALAISADGRYTVLASEATNLVPGMAAAPPGVYLFLYDRVADTTTRITRRSVENPDSVIPTAGISADGRFVVFQSRATDEIEGQTDANPGPDVFLWDRVTEETELVSRSDADPLRTGNGFSTEPAVSADGRFVAFTSNATDLVEGFSATSLTSNVFLWDRQTDEIEPVSRAAGASDRLANNNSLRPSISADGRFVAFLSLASDLVAGQVDRGTARGTVDAFLWDRTTRQTTLVSRAAGNPLVTANRASQEALVSANGRFVALNSFATNLLPGGPQPGGANIFLWDRETGTMSLASHGPKGAPAGRGFMDLTAVAADGSYVLFSSDAKNLLPSPNRDLSALNVFLWSRATGKTTLVSRSTTRGQGGNAHSIATGLSADGAWIVFESTASDLEGVTDRDQELDVFLANSRSGRITQLSAPDASAVETIDRVSTGALISADGRWIAFTSNAADFGEGVRDLNGAPDVVLTSRGGDRTVVTVHAPGLASATPPGSSFATSIDASGRFVVFITNVDAALLLPGVRELDANRFGFDVFLYDRELRTLTLVTRSATNPGLTANGTAFETRISADGRWVAFSSSATDLVPGFTPNPSAAAHVFLWDRTTGQTILASPAAGSTTTGANGYSHEPRISADGSVVVFQSQATDLVAGQTDTAGTEDIFAFDRTTGTVSLVSRAAGSATVAANKFSFVPQLSADGRIVAFSSTATDLVPGGTDTNLEYDAFLFDRVTGTMTLASRTTAPTPTAGEGLVLALSGDGRFLVFSSSASDLVPGQADLPSTHDLFLFDRIAGTATLVTHIAGSPTTAAAAGTGGADISADGRFTAFASLAANLVPGQVDDETQGISSDIFVFDRATGAIEMITRAAGTVATGGPGESDAPRISADGRRVAFISSRLDLIPGLHGPQTGYNLYVHDRPTGTATLVTHVLGDPAQVSAGDSPDFTQATGPFLNANGTVVAFTSSAPGLVPRDFNRLPDAFAASVP